LYRLKVETADASQQAANNPSFLQTKGRVLAATSPETACTLFGQEFARFYFDYQKGQVRNWEVDCGYSGPDSLLVGASEAMFKKVCSTTGPATNSSCGETGLLGFLKRFDPLLGLISEGCR
jgi:hypothetical protein